MADKDFMAPSKVSTNNTITGERLSSATDTSLSDRGVPQRQNAPQAVPPSGYKPDSLRGSNDTVPPSKFENTQRDTKTLPSGATDIQIAFEPNILDNYDAFTYHWKLFITSLPDANSGNVLNPSAQTIIAESSVTDLTIDKVELQGIAVPSVESGTGTQTIIKFEIREPSGAGLLDKMFYESLRLGIGNWLVMPCFLQLEFRSRDTESGEATGSGPSGPCGPLKWVWPIKLTNAKANVTAVGTIYDFDAIVYDELAQSNSYFSIQHNVVLSGLTTFGQAMADLQDKLNADQFEKLLDNYSIPDVYNIVVDGDLQDALLVQADANKSTSRASNYVTFDGKTASYNTGTSIDKIIDSLLGSSDKFQKAMQASSTPTSEPNSASNAPPMRDFWRIVTETKPIAFDMLRQDNAVEITIYVVKYDLGLVEATPSQTGQTTDSLAAARRRLETYATNGILKKKYNYIFTGQNDQVISFDLNMNFSFAASLSRFGGVYIDTALSDKGVSQQENARNEKEASNKIRQTLRFINDPANKKLIETEIASTKSSIENTKIDRTLKDRYIAILEYARPVNRASSVTNIQNRGGINAGGSLATDDELKLQRARATRIATRTDPNSLRFVSDVDIYSPESQAAREIAQNSRRGKLRPIPFREGMQELNLTFGIDPDSNAGRARTASLFSTALYSSLDASLQQIRITIKGDPFWLFPNNVSGNPTVLPYKSNMSAVDAINYIKRGHRAEFNSVNLFGTDNFIVIRFRTPRIYNETTGLSEPYSEVETFSGVYRVITVNSKFESGKFTQELMCILDNLINLSDFPEFLRDIEIANGLPDPTNTLDTPNSIPENSIKTQKIMGSSSIKGVQDTLRNASGNVIASANSAISSIGTVVGTQASNIPSTQGLTASDLLRRTT